jgi:hypothetical protein
MKSLLAAASLPGLGTGTRPEQLPWQQTSAWQKPGGQGQEMTQAENQGISWGLTRTWAWCHGALTKVMPGILIPSLVCKDHHQVPICGEPSGVKGGEVGERVEAWDIDIKIRGTIAFTLRQDMCALIGLYLSPFCKVCKIGRLTSIGGLGLCFTHIDNSPNHFVQVVQPYPSII